MATKSIPVYQEELQQLQLNIKTMIPQASLDIFSNDADTLAETYPSPLKLAVGDKAPLFVLPNAVNASVSLGVLLSKGPVVLTFYRGTWCPYCNLVLNGYQRILPDIKALGATLIAISPQKPGYSLTLQEKNDLQFEVLSDTGNVIAKYYVSVFKNSTESIDEAKKLGIDFYSHYEEKSGELPVPAVFIIDRLGHIIFAKSEGGDFRQRVEAGEILHALKTIV